MTDTKIEANVPQPNAVDRIIPSSSPTAKSVRQWSVALMAMRVRFWSASCISFFLGVPPPRATYGCCSVPSMCLRRLFGSGWLSNGVRHPLLGGLPARSLRTHHNKLQHLRGLGAQQLSQEGVVAQREEMRPERPVGL